MPRPKSPVQKKPVSVRMDPEMWEKAELLALHELRSGNPSQTPFDVNMSDWIRDVIADFIKDAEDEAGGPDVWNVWREESRALREQALQDQLASLAR